MARPRRSSASSTSADAAPAPKDNFRATRETIESIAVAVILAFLFRAFVAEAFVIPTGSMAPTLQGRHMDVECGECGYRYRAGASCENEDNGGQIVATTCPICRYPMVLDKKSDPNQRSFNGDRILVSKFAYAFSEPERWDVIVFKYPGNAKQNYIKRLVGLPNETLWILHGDVYSGPPGLKDGGADEQFEILRKPPRKLRAMLQLVDDSDYQAEELTAVGWPERWQDWSHPDAPSWKPRGPRQGFETAGGGDGVAWLRYRHVVPHDQDWWDISEGRVPRRLQEGQVTGQLVTDFYEYNHGTKWTRAADEWQQVQQQELYDRLRSLGLHWVGDLAIEADLQIEGDQGNVLLDLVEAGVHFTCRIDVATGRATLAMDGGPGGFQAAEGSLAETVSADTPIRGGGSYRVRFSNCDDQLLLWVNNRLIDFDGPSTYHPDKNLRPVWTEADPGDLEPAGIGAEGVGLTAQRLRLLRDVYYLATSYWAYNQSDYSMVADSGLPEILGDPQRWATTEIFARRRKDVRFAIGPEQYFPMGDNSPESRDARVWSAPEPVDPPEPPPYVERRLLIGKALLIYWPHAWRRPIPFWPNYARMGLIR